MQGVREGVSVGETKRQHRPTAKPGAAKSEWPSATLAEIAEGHFAPLRLAYEHTESALRCLHHDALVSAPQCATIGQG